MTIKIAITVRPAYHRLTLHIPTTPIIIEVRMMGGTYPASGSGGGSASRGGPPGGGGAGRGGPPGRGGRGGRGRGGRRKRRGSSESDSESERERKRASKGKGKVYEKPYFDSEGERERAMGERLSSPSDSEDEDTGPSEPEEHQLYQAMKESREEARRAHRWQEQMSHASQPTFRPPKDYVPAPSELEETYTPTPAEIARAAADRRRRRHQMKKKLQRKESRHTAATQTRTDLHLPTHGQEMKALEFRLQRAKYRRNELEDLDLVGEEEWREPKTRKRGVYGIGLGETERQVRESSVSSGEDYDEGQEWAEHMERTPTPETFESLTEQSTEAGVPDWVDQWDWRGRWKGIAPVLQGVVSTPQTWPKDTRDDEWDAFEKAEEEYKAIAKKNSSAWIHRRLRRAKVEAEEDPEDAFGGGMRNRGIISALSAALRGRRLRQIELRRRKEARAALPEDPTTSKRGLAYRAERDRIRALARELGEEVSELEYELRRVEPPPPPSPVDNDRKDPDWVPPPEQRDAPPEEVEEEGEEEEGGEEE